MLSHLGLTLDKSEQAWAVWARAVDLLEDVAVAAADEASGPASAVPVVEAGARGGAETAHVAPMVELARERGGAGGAR